MIIRQTMTDAELVLWATNLVRIAEPSPESVGLSAENVLGIKNSLQNFENSLSVCQDPRTATRPAFAEKRELKRRLVHGLSGGRGGLPGVSAD